jgi:hypothetical protein
MLDALKPVLNSLIVAAGAFITMTYFLHQKPEIAAEKASLLGGVFLVYMIVFGHGVAGHIINPRIFRMG